VTALGVEQSQRAGRELRDMFDSIKKNGKNKKNGQRIHFVVSPLRRALQTTEGILSQLTMRDPTNDGDPTNDDDDDEDDDEEGLRIKVTVHPAAAEILRDPCDIGTPVQQLEKEFPNCFDWGLVRRRASSAGSPSHEGGIWWGTGRYNASESWKRMRMGLPDGVETDDQVEERLQGLRDYICKLSASDVVVIVCHSETIWCLSSLRGMDGDMYGIWTKNGEIVDLTERILRPPHEDTATEASSQSGGGGSSGGSSSRSSSSGESSGLDERYQPFEVFLT